MAEALAAADIAPDRVLASPHALVVVDDDCICVEVSLGACSLLGTARSEVVGRNLEQLLESESRERFAHAWRAFRDRGGYAEPFALEAPATAVEIGITVIAEVLPARHLVLLDPNPRRDSDDPGEPHRRRFAPQDRPILREPTTREREVLALLAGGSTDGQIAERLGLSPATVQTHVRNAKSKLGAQTRAQAVAMALRQGLISVP